MPAAVIGGAIAAAGTVGGAAIASSSAQKASKSAAQAQQDATAANNALQQQIYNRNAQTLAPYINSGYGATSAINALLGIGGPANDTAPNSTVTGTPVYGGTNGYTPGDAWVGNNPTKGPDYGRNALLGSTGAIGDGQVLRSVANPTTTVNTAPPNAQQQYKDAFANYRNSTGYDFRVNEGQDAINTGYAAGGKLRSGAALKSLENYRQGVASSEFNNYLNSLFNVSNLGLSAAGAQAGVSTNYANTVGANNNAAASAAGNAALLRGQANAGLYSTVGNALGNLGGSIFSSSFGNNLPQQNAWGISGSSGIY